MAGSPRIEAPVNPDVLVWARESVGYSRERAAELLGMTETNLGMIEEGVKPISFARLQVMAEKYDRPVIALLLPEVPQLQDHLPDFRTSPEYFSKSWSPALHKAYRRVLGQRTIMLDLVQRSGESPPAIDLTIAMSRPAEDTGKIVRAWLAPHGDFSEHDDNVVLRFWSALLEDRGILVSQVSGVDVQEMRGFSISERPFPIIALNGADTVRGRTFTLMHELVHVLLHRSSLCDLDEPPLANTLARDETERYCNSVAAAVLMPRPLLLAERIVATASPTTRWSESDLSYLADRFTVSEEAMLRRLVTLNKTSWEFYMERRAYYLAIYRRREKQSGGPGHYYLTLRNLGRRYVRTVWNAYERGDISDPEVSRYLQTSFAHIPTLIERAGLAR
jgi:Zn-dependent peptidase ImmA (M78 family)/transcriptional regulator with XRE-family HTH domain